MRFKVQGKPGDGQAGESAPAPDQTVPLWSTNAPGSEKRDPLPKPTHQLIQLWSDPV